MPKSLGEKAYERGFEYEKNYGGCAQCVIASLYDVFPELKNEDVFRSATGLGAGVVDEFVERHFRALDGGSHDLKPDLRTGIKNHR